MKMISKRKIVAVLFTAMALPAFAQLPGLGALGSFAGGGKNSGGDPVKIEADIQRIIVTTSFAGSKLYEALGDKENAAKMQKLADDLKSGSIGLSDATSNLNAMSASLIPEMEKAKKEGTKADAVAAQAAAQAILPAIETLPLWASVIDGIKNLDKTKSFSGAGLSLVRAATQLPSAAKNTADLFTNGISYLSYNGIKTKDLESSMAKSLKGKD
jgi:hypothetical protein